MASLIMWWFTAKPGQGRIKDLAVFGDTIAAHIAVLAALEQGLTVRWVRTRPDSPRPENRDAASEFDSLAPEGVRYLCHLLNEDDIRQLQLGYFTGIHRNHQYQAFDVTLLGHGIQFNTQQLKHILQQKAGERAQCLLESHLTITPGAKHWMVQDKRSGLAHPCRWIINAQGEFSALSQQAPVYLSDDLWIERKLCPQQEKSTNQVFFNETPEGWQWSAWDNQGNLCETVWRNHRKGYCQSSQAVLTSRAFNARWYQRQHCLEYLTGAPTPILLTIPTFVRFDPACGLGTSLHIKSALHAISCIRECLSRPDKAQQALAQYQAAMLSTVKDITGPMADFYLGYGIHAGKYYIP